MRLRNPRRARLPLRVKADVRFKQMKKILTALAVVVLSCLCAWWFLRESDSAIVRRIEVLKEQQKEQEGKNLISMSWYEQDVLRRRLASRGYLIQEIYDLPNTRMETERSRALWAAMLTFRDRKCSALANFGMGPANGSTAALYVTVIDLPSHIPQWKEMLQTWDAGVAETKDARKEGPVSGPTGLAKEEANNTSDGIRQPANGLPKPSR